VIGQLGRPALVQRPAGWLRRRWRRSLQLRVVATTMSLGLLVAAVFGTLLIRRIESGLVSQRLVEARGEAERGLRDAQGQLDTVSDSSDLNLLVNDMLPRLASPDPDDAREVVMLRSESNSRPAILPDLGSRDVEPSLVPQELRRRVAASGRQEEQFVRVRYSDSNRTAAGIAIGSDVQVPAAGPHEIYFIFSLEREQETIDLVRRSLLVGGLVLVLLVGGVAYVVTRQVVRPVRQAAVVAHRLSSGRLQERMPSRGEDDLALLAGSFNTMAENLQRQIGQLEQLSRVQQRFVSDVSHELRTPLTTIRMAVDVLHEARVDFAPEVARSAELLMTQLDRFEGLLGDLLEMSRIDAGGDLLDLDSVDLLEVVARAVDGCAGLAASCGSPVEVSVVPAGGPGPVAEPDGSGPMAEVDGRRIERILRNLLVNALEHGEGGAVVVTVAADRDAVAVSVRDFGVGLRPGEASLVFNRFWRADPARARKVGGTGLGLAIAHEDARLHGGWLQAWGEAGQGSCFRLTLPRRVGAEIVSSPLPLAPSTAAPVSVGRAYQRLTPPASGDPAQAGPAFPGSSSPGSASPGSHWPGGGR
jgi:two-component system, OmpR family, sensor histidine kinase MtrB